MGYKKKETGWLIGVEDEFGEIRTCGLFEWGMSPNEIYSSLSIRII
jgi:hypothetical protein